jgi:hypothetical protein
MGEASLPVGNARMDVCYDLRPAKLVLTTGKEAQIRKAVFI